MGKSKKDKKRKNRDQEVLSGLPMLVPQPRQNSGYGYQPQPDNSQLRQFSWWGSYKYRKQLDRNMQVVFYETELVKAQTEKARAIDEQNLQPMETAVKVIEYQSRAAQATQAYLQSVQLTRKITGENDLQEEKIKLLKGERKELGIKIRLLKSGKEEDE